VGAAQGKTPYRVRPEHRPSLAERLRRTARILVSTVLAVLVAANLPGREAYADPSVADIERQINKIWNDAEPLIEKYNEVHEKYRKNMAKQSDLNHKIEPLQRQVDLAHVRLGVVAAQVYKGGNADVFNAMMTSGSPKQLADQLEFLDHLARMQARQISGVTEMKSEYDAKKAPLDQLVAELAEQDAELAKQKKVIESKLEELNRLRQRAYGSGGGTGSYRPWPCPAKYEPTNGYKAANFACKQAGDRYGWAAEGPNAYDCSGLTLVAWRQVGVHMPHNAAAQRRSTPRVSRANLRVGDLVFYYGDLHHVAIYVGGGKVMHAPTYGDRVRMAVLEDVGPVHSYGRPN
jgi:peptidoglycan DL-endopeptidase CwlO